MCSLMSSIGQKSTVCSLQSPDELLIINQLLAPSDLLISSFPQFAIEPENTAAAPIGSGKADIESTSILWQNPYSVIRTVKIRA